MSNVMCERLLWLGMALFFCYWNYCLGKAKGAKEERDRILRRWRDKGFLENNENKEDIWS